MLEIVLSLVAVLICQFMQAVDDFLSQFGVVSVAHGVLLGYGQVYAAKALLVWGGGQLSWVVVTMVAVTAMAVSAYKIHNTGTRWVFAFNFGILCGILYGGFDLI